MAVKRPWLLVTAILICQAAGLIGAAFTSSNLKSWYLYLNKPAFSPPDFIFGPVWTVLYTLMGVALYRIWVLVPKGDSRQAVKLFFIHLVTNASWSLVFFGAKNVTGGLIIITALWLMILYLIKKFGRLDKAASLLLYPYLAWVMFATILNFSIWVLNM